jgi:hypothetical protein
MINPLLVPPRLVARALEDLHEIARAARVITEAADDPGRTPALAGALDDLDAQAELARSVPDTQRALSARLDALDRRAGETLEATAVLSELGERLEAAVALGERLESRGETIAETGGRLDQRAGHGSRGSTRAPTPSSSRRRSSRPLRRACSRWGSGSRPRFRR